MRVFNRTILNNQSLNVSVNSPAVQLKYIVLYSISFIVTGTPNGAVKLQASNDPETELVDVNPPTNWVDIDDSTFTLTTAGNTTWNVRDSAYNYVRVVWTKGTNNTGVVKCIFNGKGD